MAGMGDNTYMPYFSAGLYVNAVSGLAHCRPASSTMIAIMHVQEDTLRPWKSLIFWLRTSSSFSASITRVYPDSGITEASTLGGLT